MRVNRTTEAFYLREISGGIRNYHPLHSREELIDRLLSGDSDASFIDSGIGEYLANNIYCHRTLVGSGFDVSTFGIVFPKHWLYIEEFERNLLAPRQLDYLNTFENRWFESNVCQDSVETPNTNQELSAANVRSTGHCRPGRGRGDKTSALNFDERSQTVSRSMCCYSRFSRNDDRSMNFTAELTAS